MSPRDDMGGAGDRPGGRPRLSVIVPASNEAGYIGACLGALFAADDPAGVDVEVIVVANGCHDATADIARGFAPEALRRGWRFDVLERAEGGKSGALNAGDAAAWGEMRAYVDADVRVSPPLLAQIAAALDRERPVLASGRAEIAPARSRVTRAYGRFWQSLPFHAVAAPAFGLFAVNAPGRARWGAFPQIISDDSFARLHFAPDERIAVTATYDWPLPEGFARLVRVRRRQDAGVAEIARRYPALAANEDKVRVGAAGLARRALADPAGFAVYAAVALAVRTLPGRGGWARGR